MYLSISNCSLWLGLAWAAASAAVPSADTPAATPSESHPSAAPAVSPLQLADPLTRLHPFHTRSDQDLDRIESASRYAFGRLLYHRKDEAGALRQYQRSFRLLPSATSVLAEIVPLAVRLGRPAVAARYATMATARDPVPSGLLRQLAIYLSEKGEYADAARLYQLILEKDSGQTDAPDPSRVFVHYELGRLYFLTGEYEKSATSFALVRAALDEPARFGLGDPMRKLLLGNAAATYTIMAESYLRAGRPLGAAALVSAANRAKPNPSRLALKLAQVAEAQGHWADALEQLDKYFDAGAERAGIEPYELLQRILEHQQPGKPAQQHLIRRLEDLRRQDPQNAALGYFLASHYLAAGDRDHALQLYQQLVRVEPTVEGYQALVESYRREHLAGALLDVLGQVVSRSGDLKLLGESASALFRDTEMVDRVMAVTRNRMEADDRPVAAATVMAAAFTAAGAGRWDEAAPLVDRAANDHPDRAAGFLSSWGLELFLAEQYDRSIVAFRRALTGKLKPDAKALLYFYLAGALELSGKTEEALTAINHAGKQAGESAIIESRRGWIFSHAGRNKESEAAYRELLQRFDPDKDRSPELRQVVQDARSALSNLCLLRDAMDEAEEWLQLILDEFPNDAGALNDLGYLWADQGKHLHRALDMVARAVAQQPDNVAYRDSLGWTLYRLGRYQQAIEQLAKAADVESPDGIILDHLGDAYARVNNIPAAVASWLKAVESLQRDQQPDRIAEIKIKIQQHRSE